MIFFQKDDTVIAVGVTLYLGSAIIGLGIYPPNVDPCKNRRPIHFVPMDPSVDQYITELITKSIGLGLTDREIFALVAPVMQSQPCQFGVKDLEDVVAGKLANVPDIKWDSTITLEEISDVKNRCH